MREHEPLVGGEAGFSLFDDKKRGRVKKVCKFNNDVINTIRKR